MKNKCHKKNHLRAFKLHLSNALVRRAVAVCAAATLSVGMCDKPAIAAFLSFANFNLDQDVRKNIKIDVFERDNEGKKKRILKNLDLSFTVRKQGGLIVVGGTEKDFDMAVKIVGSNPGRSGQLLKNKWVKEIPEPITILGSLTALGFGAYFKKEYSRKQKKAKVKA